MRTNLPVTGIEYPISDETLIVSKTDLKGKLIYFNDQFVDAAGFTEDELTGQPHNIIRHPDMPPEAFDNLWSTLKAGKPWAGAVKNRRKNGDHYWVLASATPIWEGGHVTGYMSIRSKLPADQRDEAERVYGLFRTGKARGYRLDAGTIRKRAVADVLSFFTKTLKMRLVTMTAALATSMLIIGAAGLVGMGQIDKRAESIYQDRVVPLVQLFEINDRMKDNSLALYGAVAHGRSGQAIGDVRGRVEGNIATISKRWSEYMSIPHTAEETTVANAFVPLRMQYVQKGLRVGLSMLAERKFDELDEHMAGNANQLFMDAKAELDKLVDIQLKESKAEYERAGSTYLNGNLIAITVTCLGLLLGGVLAWATVRVISRPLTHLNHVMSLIAKGVFNTRVLVERDDEAGIALRNLQAMQSKLGFDRESKKDMEARAVMERKADMNRLAGEFETAIGEIIETVASASTELEASACSLMHTANSTQQLSVAVASASEQMSSNVQSVASATEEMASSVNEISRQIDASSEISNAAVSRRSKPMIELQS